MSPSALLGAVPIPEGTQFLVWAPHAERLAVHLTEPRDVVVEMTRVARGYHHALVEGLGPGARYRFALPDGRELPDPASRFQPEGVPGPSEVVDPSSFAWADQAFSAPPLREFVLYEMHVGTFSTEGTFDGAVAHLDELVDLGVTAVEPLPVAQFPGYRNWGYDGVFPYAVQDSYGGPEGFARFVDACHKRGLAVTLDVVYNHLGPEGAVHREFGPYFTDKYRTPWGDAVNVDGPGSDEVRRYFIENALMWFRDFHVDALRLDAVHGIVDQSAHPFLQELAEATDALSEELGRPLYLIAESDLNDPRLIRGRDDNGFGIHSQWADDYHHAVHAFLTGETSGYYSSFGEVEHIARAFRSGFVYTGQYSPFRERRHGAPVDDIPAERFVVYNQNHDQTGNRLLGERLGALVSFEQLKLAAGLLLLSPYVPLLFMGEEYGETAPFQYFISHSDPDLVEAVRKGRAEEFASFEWSGEAPDPQAEETFERARLDRSLKTKDQHRHLLELHRELIRLRRELNLPGAATQPAAGAAEVGLADDLITVTRRHPARPHVVLFNLAEDGRAGALPEGAWELALDSASPRWNGPGSTLPQEAAGGGSIDVSPTAFAVYRSADR